MQNGNGAENAQKKRRYRCLTNVSLLVFGFIMTFSGLYIQVCYHMRGDSFSLGFSQWTIIHKWSALLFTLISITHIVLHLKWYKIVIEKQLFRKNRATLVLTIFMIIVSLTGFLPWIMSLFPIHLALRRTLIEIHDKIGVIFMVILIGHIIKRGNWYIHMR